MDQVTITPELREEIFVFLNVLRESGACNMFGAGPYVQDEFGLTRHQAKDVVVDWMTDRSTSVHRTPK